MSKRPAWRKAAIVLATAVALGAGAAGTASFAANDVVGEFEHFINCFDFMINDQFSHRRNCQPNRVVVPLTSLSEPGPAAPIPLGTN